MNVESMQPVYVDLHIHTSKHPDRLDPAYDVAKLHDKIRACAAGSAYLISLTDHNTINKAAYLNAASLFPNLLIGAELHVRNYRTEQPYHCHIFFRSPVSADAIDELNKILDVLYPKKRVCASDSIPTIEEIAKDIPISSVMYFLGSIVSQRVFISDIAFLNCSAIFTPQNAIYKIK